MPRYGRLCHCYQVALRLLQENRTLMDRLWISCQTGDNEGDEFRQIVAELRCPSKVGCFPLTSANEIQDLEFRGGNGFLNSDGLRAVPVYLP